MRRRFPCASTKRCWSFIKRKNALAIARNAGREHLCSEHLLQGKEALLTEAQQINASKNGDSHAVVDSAREAAQTAEDARQIAERRMHDDQLAKANAKVTSAEQARAAAEAEVLRARADADAARSQADAERVARQQAEAASAVARDRAAQAEQAARDTQAQASAANAAATAVTAGRVLQEQVENQKAELRMRLLEQLNGALASRDTAFGLMVTVPDNTFAAGLLKPMAFDHIRRISQIVNANPGLRVVIEGHAEKGGSDVLALKRAEAVRDQLVASGLSATLVEVRPMGDSRPLGPNSTENRRVEIIISGDPIGKFPYWDRPYTLSMHR